MGLQLPAELTSLLGTLGYTWPEADETVLFELGQKWLAFAQRLPVPIGELGQQAQRVWLDNTADATEAFRAAWSAPDAAQANLEDGATAAALIGIGLMVCATIVLVLKINVIIQLVLLAIQIAQALATAGPTLGASLAEITIFKIIAPDCLLLLAVADDVGRSDVEEYEGNSHLVRITRNAVTAQALYPDAPVAHYTLEEFRAMVRKYFEFLAPTPEKKSDSIAKWEKENGRPYPHRAEWGL